MNNYEKYFKSKNLLISSRVRAEDDKIMLDIATKDNENDKFDESRLVTTIICRSDYINDLLELYTNWLNSHSEILTTEEVEYLNSVSHFLSKTKVKDLAITKVASGVYHDKVAKSGILLEYLTFNIALTDGRYDSFESPNTINLDRLNFSGLELGKTYTYKELGLKLPWER